ncbi:uncharacterized protein LOC144382928 [Gasterosteus aculeatus]
MQSRRSEHSHRRQYRDRSPRLKDDYDHRWEERREPPRDPPQDSYQKYGGNGCSSKERTSRSRQYSDSPKMLYSEDSLNRDLSRKTSARRRMSSPDWGSFEKKSQRNAEDGNRYRLEPENDTTRRSPNSFSRAHVTKDFKQMLTQEEDFQHRKTPQDSRHKYVHDEFTYRQQQDNCRQSSGYYKDRVGHQRSRDRSQERKSRDRSKKCYVKPRVRNDSPSLDHEEYRQNIGRFPLSASSGQSFESDVTNQSAVVPEQESTVGFQRFLNVLNKGVNVATLTKIVTQSSTEVSDRSSPPSFVNTDFSWSPSYAEGQHGSHQNTGHWSDSEGFQRLASSQPRERSFSPRRQSLSDEKSVQRGNEEPSNLSSNSRSKCPSGEQKITLSPEEEHKQRQMQSVLQAIGMNLGSEELGQMSHRIQERLYGKKDRDCNRRESREMDTRRAFSPRPDSRSSSSSSRSSYSPLNQKYYKKKDSYSVQSDVTEVHQDPVHEGVEYGRKSTSSTLQQSDKCETWSEESTAAPQAFSQNLAYTFLKPSPTPAMPVYSPVDCLSASYPPFPPNLPHLGTGLHMPPFFPFPHAPPVSIFPAVLAQARHLLPQRVGNPPFFNLSGNNPNPPLNNTQKSKPLSRPRFLQVIETKQPG